jgi:hypothetical protein
MHPSQGGEWDSKPHEEVSITSGCAKRQVQPDLIDMIRRQYGIYVRQDY